MDTELEAAISRVRDARSTWGLLSSSELASEDERLASEAAWHSLQAAEDTLRALLVAKRHAA